MENQGNSFIASMLHEIKNTLRGEPHTFGEIRSMLEDARIEEKHLLDVLQQHHHFLNESIMFLLDKESTVAEKQIHLERFIRIFEMHAQAEAETLYRSLLRHSDHAARREGFVGQDEHGLAFRLIEELKTVNYKVEWTDDIDAKVQVLSNLAANHFLEEEGVMFPLARRVLLPGEFVVLANDYLDLCELALDGDTRTALPGLISWPINP